MTGPRLLDLFCGAGGCSVGYRRAGFDVVGVDAADQPDYPFELWRMDALAALQQAMDVEAGRHEDRYGPGRLSHFDAIHASPPCQAHTSMKTMWNAREHIDLVDETRRLLIASGLPYVIENVEGAPLRNPVRMCGASLGLGTATHDLARHRIFETNFPLMVPPCAHGSRPVVGLYGDHLRDRRRVAGGGADRGRDFPDAAKLEMGRRAMGMPWVTRWKGLSQAVPPAYTEHIGGYLMAAISQQAAA